MARSKIRALAILFFSGYLIASCFALKGKAEDVTTDNILSQTFTSGNNWTGQLSSNHGTGIIAGVDEGHVENTEAYSLVDDADISADQFNNGFTSNLSAKVWFWNSNNQDVVMKQIITNSDGNVTTQTKTITGSCATFNGCSYQNTGNNTYSIGSNTQTDFDIKTRFEFNSTPAGSASYSGTHRAADLKQPVLTITYDDTVLDTETTDALDDVEEALEDLQDEVFEDMEEFFFEEEYFTFNTEEDFSFEEEIYFDDEMYFSDEFFDEFFEEEGMSFDEEPMMEFTETEMEEMYEETNELVETFLPMVSEEEEFSSEESFTETDGSIFMESTETGETFEEEAIEEEVVEESTEMAEEEVMEEENTEMAEEEAVEEESTEMVEADDEETFEEEAQEEEPTSETATTSSVQDEKLAKQKKVQQKKAIVKNLDRIMDKVDKDIKDIAKNLAVKNIIKMQAMTSEQASLDMYQNAIFYRPKDIYLDQLNIFDNRQIYPNTNLASYTQNDKIEIKARKLQEINSRKQKLLMELEILKNAS